jgi:ATP-dependent Clp protease ATP-binding subunit ClpB
VQDPLAELILAGEIHDGEKVVVGADKNGLLIGGEAFSHSPERAPSVVNFQKGA